MHNFSIFGNTARSPEIISYRKTIPLFTKLRIAIWSVLTMLLLPDIYIPTVSAQLPPIIITATRTPVLCTGSACRQAIEELTRLLLPENYFQQSRPETPEPVEATKEQVCAAIKAKQPPGCT